MKNLLIRAAAAVLLAAPVSVAITLGVTAPHPSPRERAVIHCVATTGLPLSLCEQRVHG